MKAVRGGLPSPGEIWLYEHIESSCFALSRDDGRRVVGGGIWRNAIDPETCLSAASRLRNHSSANSLQRTALQRSRRAISMQTRTSTGANFSENHRFPIMAAERRSFGL